MRQYKENPWVLRQGVHPVPESGLVSEIEEHVYLEALIEKYKTLESIYTDLPVAVPPQLPDKFLPTLLDTCSFEVLIERSFGQEYRTVDRIRFPRIQDFLDNHPRIVLLGDPGSGKTVTIWRLALDYAIEALAEPSELWPVVFELGRYDGSVPFYDWLLLQGQAVPDFLERLRLGRLLMLLDGLNEMPRERYSESISQLHRFIDEYRACSFVVTCRRLDYDESLGLRQVEIEPLDKERIHTFISRYIEGKNGEHLYNLLQADAKLLELASNALNLKLIISLYVVVGDRFPRNRSKLIDGFVGALYERELRRLRAAPIAETELRTALGALAFGIQAEMGKGTAVERKWASARVHSRLPQADVQPMLDFAAGMGLLDLVKSSLKFQHQLIQEYFAALELEKHLSDKESQNHFWSPSAKKDLSRIGEPIPPPPTTGWEEATIMLAGIKKDASELVAQVLGLNPLLAARCICEGRASVQSEVHKAVIAHVLAEMQDPNAELNKRVHAGLLVGKLEDPRFERIALPKGYALLPPLIRIPSGAYTIGSDEDEISNSYLDEIPRHLVTLEGFWIGEFPVTNAEFGCFIREGGYHQRRYWTDQGWAWREGRFDENLKQWLLDGYRNVRAQCLQEPDRLEPSRQEDSEEMDIWWKILMDWPEERVERELDGLFDERNCRPHTEPCYWNDPAFNSETQPVITAWFEALAYCRWLSEVTDKLYRLPTEVEWEAATGGRSQKRPWGDTPDTSRFNVLSSYVLRTTPVGIYPTGISVFGVHDLVGNVWEWTSSSKLPYPYRIDDGRENPFLPDSRRVVRGGSWAVSESSARNSCRGNFPSDNMVRNYIGFRVICDEDRPRLTPHEPDRA